jgi:hypothetical protein
MHRVKLVYAHHAQNIFLGCLESFHIIALMAEQLHTCLIYRGTCACLVTKSLEM